MIVVLDTNALLQIFGARSPFAKLQQAILDGQVRDSGHQVRVSLTRGATNAQQWYVSISRGRKSVRIFTPDKAELRAHITKTGDRPLAMDLDAAKRERKAIRLGMFHLLRRGLAFARTVALMFARKRSIQDKKQTITV